MSEINPLAAHVGLSPLFHHLRAVPALPQAKTSNTHQWTLASAAMLATVVVEATRLGIGSKVTALLQVGTIQN
jgi:hypothetical protein